MPMEIRFEETVNGGRYKRLAVDGKFENRGETIKAKRSSK